MKSLIQQSNNLKQTKQLAHAIGQKLRGGEVFELIGDLGGGKTSFVSGLADGFGSVDPVASPSFTLNYVYRCRDGMQLSHFDFYRLDDPGIVANELSEVIGEPDTVVAVEWGDNVHGVLPENKIKLSIVSRDENSRTFTYEYADEYDYLFSDVVASGEQEKK
jgi:tRNA threonylcarbamoyladenosine biosynthesis protein TsaE